MYQKTISSAGLATAAALIWAVLKLLSNGTIGFKLDFLVVVVSKGTPLMEVDRSKRSMELEFDNGFPRKETALDKNDGPDTVVAVVGVPTTLGLGVVTNPADNAELLLFRWSGIPAEPIVLEVRKDVTAGNGNPTFNIEWGWDIDKLDKDDVEEEVDIARGGREAPNEAIIWISTFSISSARSVGVNLTEEAGGRNNK